MTDSSSRRKFVQGTTAAGVAMLGLDWQSFAHAAPADGDGDLTGRYFKFEVEGIYNEVGVTSVSVPELSITVEEATQGDKPEPVPPPDYGDTQLDDSTVIIQFPAVPAIDPDKKKGPLDDWIDCDGNDDTPETLDVTLYVLANDKNTVARVINYFQVYPVSCNQKEGENDGANVKVVELRHDGFLEKSYLKEEDEGDAGLHVKVNGKTIPVHNKSGGTKSGKGPGAKISDLVLDTYLGKNTDWLANQAHKITQGAKPHFEVEVTDAGGKTQTYGGCALRSLGGFELNGANKGPLVRRVVFVPHTLD